MIDTKSGQDSVKVARLYEHGCLLYWYILDRPHFLMIGSCIIRRIPAHDPDTIGSIGYSERYSSGSYSRPKCIVL